jgi:hypothetical protein
VVNSTDCDDTTALVNPGEPETCDGTDNNCSGNENDASDATTWYSDSDSDSYGDDGEFTNACAQPSGYIVDNTDCNDINAAINPGAAETCDGTDNNCSGDESDASDAVTYYADGDTDTFGDALDSVSACAQPGGYVVDNTDCDDLAATTYPGAVETCHDGTDADCDGADSNSACDMDLSGAEAIVYGETNLDLMGYSVAAGDINGDGIDDILTGGRLDDDAGADAGAAYVLFGPVTGTVNASAADTKLRGEAAGDYFAISIDAGDVDGDGYDDLMIGALNDDDGGTDAGAAYVVLGPISGTSGIGTSADAKWTGVAAGDSAGRNVASAGDVDGDGFIDLIIGANNNDDVDVNAGAAYLLYGPVTTDNTLTNADAILTGAAGQDRAGYWVDGARDVDGDGFDDLFIGAYRADTVVVTEVEGNTTTTTTSNTGAAYVVFGPASGTIDLATSDVIFRGESASDQAGSVVAGAGDVDGDGYADLLIGARHADPGGNASAGIVYLVNGSATLTGDINLSTADAEFTGEAAGDQAGRGIDGAGDIDNDTHGDILIGAYKNANSATDAGAAYLLLGPFSGSTSLSAADGIFQGETADDQAGINVYGGGDVSGDGSPDMLIGATVGGTSEAGALYLLHGESWR